MIRRRLTTLMGNSQKLDGGAMFGNAPRALWSRWAPPDELNRIDLACRCLLIEELEGPFDAPQVRRRILLEAGIGAFFTPEMRERFGVQEAEHCLLSALEARGLSPADIDLIVLSHLHFDHAGGLLCAWSEGAAAALAFPEADVVVSQEAWDRACQPHRRDRASFIPELPGLLEESPGRLERVRGDQSELLGPAYRLHSSEGHTPGLMLVEFPGPEGPLVFGGDLIPGLPWVRAAITMGYDRFPERLIDEKEALLEDLLGRGGGIFFTHDPQTSCCYLERDPRGRIIPRDPRATLQLELS